MPQSGVRLDCRGFRVFGQGDGRDQYGIYLNEVTGATVEGCDVSGFLRGIRLRGAHDNVIRNNTAHHNGDFSTRVGYGIDLALAPTGNLIRGNLVSQNADEGIHVGSGSADNQFVDNVVTDNYREQIYVLASDGNTFVGNTAGGTGSNSLYLKDSNDTYLEGNTFRDRYARVTGDSQGNAFVDNVFQNATLHFRVYDDAVPHRIPTGNSVSGGSMSHTGTCLRFTQASGNTVSDVALAGCATDVLSEGAVEEPSSNQIISTALASGKVFVDLESTLSVGWRLSVHVQDASGTPVTGARVQGRDVQGNLVFDLVTDGNGDLPPQVVLQDVLTGSGTTAKTPHTLTTTKAGRPSDTRVVQATRDLNVTVVLGSESPPLHEGEFTDGFDRPDSEILGNGWLEMQGDLMIAAAELSNAPVKGYHLAVQSRLSGPTQTAAADFASTDNGNSPRFGIVLRFRDAANYYVLYRQAGGTSRLRISRVVNGVERILTQTHITNPTRDTFFRLEGRASGTTLTLSLDGVRRLSVSDSTFAGGSPGILLGSKYTRSYRADNFTATVE
jgi:parallel beta-helix repeat protein